MLQQAGFRRAARVLGPLLIAGMLAHSLLRPLHVSNPSTHAAPLPSASASPTVPPLGVSAARTTPAPPEAISQDASYVGAVSVRSLNASIAQPGSAEMVNVGGYPLCKWTSVCMWANQRDRFIGGMAGPEVALKNSSIAEAQTNVAVEDRNCFPAHSSAGLRSWNSHLELSLLAEMPSPGPPPQVVWLPGSPFARSL
jgi:hypothetical protein